MLKQTYTLIFFVLFFGTILWSQKNVDLDRKLVQLSFVDLPDQKVDSSWKGYTLQVDNSENFMGGGYPLEALESKKLLNGYVLDKTNPDLVLRLSSSRIGVTAVDVKNKSTTTKDKSGKETTTYTYWYDLTYTYSSYATLSKKDGIVLRKFQYGGERHSTGPTFSTHAAAAESYNNNRGTVVSNLLRQEVSGAVSGIHADMNHAYGFLPRTSTLNLWEIGSKKHPEYENFVATSSKCAEIFKAQISAHGSIEAAKEALAPVIEYYQALPNKYSSEEKVDKKIRYAAYYDLALIYFALEDLDKVKAYADLLIKNDYDPKDGEDWLKQVEGLQKQYQLNGYTTRHFDREAIIKKARGVVAP